MEKTLSAIDSEKCSQAGMGDPGATLLANLGLGFVVSCMCNTSAPSPHQHFNNLLLTLHSSLDALHLASPLHTSHGAYLAGFTFLLLPASTRALNLL